MAKYSVSSASAGTQQALATTYKTLLSVTAVTGATTLRRGWIYDIEFGADGTPADNVMVFKVDRQTTVGTGTAATAAPLDAADAAVLLVGTVNHTAEPGTANNPADRGPTQSEKLLSLGDPSRIAEPNWWCPP